MTGPLRAGASKTKVVEHPCPTCGKPSVLVERLLAGYARVRCLTHGVVIVRTT
jgi:hypothetical protein